MIWLCRNGHLVRSSERAGLDCHRCRANVRRIVQRAEAAERERIEHRKVNGAPWGSASDSTRSGDQPEGQGKQRGYEADRQRPSAEDALP